MKNRYFFIIIGLFFFFFIVLFKGLKNPNVYIPELQNEKNLSKFEAIDFYSNKKISSFDIFNDNNFYLINIWASWCFPCKIEHPLLIRLSNLNNLQELWIGDNLSLTQISNPLAPNFFARVTISGVFSLALAS